MINSTELVTDTGAQRRDHLVSTYGCAIVPLAIVIDGEEFREDQLDPATFYTRIESGATVTTAAPSPGDLLKHYQAAADEGAAGVLSMHMSSDLSATFNSARIASEMSPIPVALMDTAAIGFGVDLCVETAAKALRDGADPAGAIAAAQAVRARAVNVFVVGQPAMFERGGRSHVVGHEISPTSVLATGTDVREIARVDDVDAMVSTMIGHVVECAGGSPVWAGVGHADSPAIAERLASGLRSEATIAELATFDLGLSLAAHLGPGTVAITFCTLG